MHCLIFHNFFFISHSVLFNWKYVSLIFFFTFLNWELVQCVIIAKYMYYLCCFQNSINIVIHKNYNLSVYVSRNPFINMLDKEFLQGNTK